MDGAFRYCPWCGKASLDAGDARDVAERMDRVFDRLAEMQRDDAFARFDRMELALGSLELELSRMVAVSHSA